MSALDQSIETRWTVHYTATAALRVHHDTRAALRVMPEFFELVGPEGVRDLVLGIFGVDGVQLPTRSCLCKLQKEQKNKTIEEQNNKRTKKKRTK